MCTSKRAAEDVCLSRRALFARPKLVGIAADRGVLPLPKSNAYSTKLANLADAVEIVTESRRATCAPSMALDELYE